MKQKKTKPGRQWFNAAVLRSFEEADLVRNEILAEGKEAKVKRRADGLYVVKTRPKEVTS